MSIGRYLATLLAASVVVAAAGCRSTATQGDSALHAPTAAWWYAMEFTPVSGVVRGIDIVRFDTSWSRASALVPAMLEDRVPPAGLAALRDSGMSFSLQADLDGDRTAEDFFVGVFSTHDGDHGRFVAVSRNGQLLQRFTQSGPTGFSALLVQDDEVRWYKCLQCGEFESIRWSGDSYVLE